MGRSIDELEAGLPHIIASPADAGRVRLIVRRPRSSEREALEEAQLDLTAGLVGDDWLARGSKRTLDGASDPDAQLTCGSRTNPITRFAPIRSVVSEFPITRP
jgi:hypothetical protein